MIAHPATGRRRLMLRLVDQHKRIHAGAAERRERRHKMAIHRDLANDRYVYENGDPIDRDDPRLPIVMHHRDGWMR